MSKIPDTNAKDFFAVLFNLDFLTEEQKQTIFDGAELYSKGKLRVVSEQLSEKEKQIGQLVNRVRELEARDGMIVVKQESSDCCNLKDSRIAKLREFIQKAANANVGRPSELVSQFEKYQEAAKQLLSETK